MQSAIALSVDHEVHAAYVTYRALPAGAVVATSTRLNEDVVVNFDDEGRILGIELIELRPEAIESAEAFAEQNGLDFPALRLSIREA